MSPLRANELKAKQEETIGLLRQNQPPWKYGESIAPVVVSILAIVVWLIFILLYALFWSAGFTLFQNIIVTLVSLAIAGLMIGLMWVLWGTRYAKVHEKARIA